MVQDGVFFDQEFDELLLLFLLPNAIGGPPAGIRIRQVTNKWFRAWVVEPLPSNGEHSQQTVHYLAITTGIHMFPDGTKVTEKTEVISNIKAGSGVCGQQSWHLINY